MLEQLKEAYYKDQIIGRTYKIKEKDNAYSIQTYLVIDNNSQNYSYIKYKKFTTTNYQQVLDLTKSMEPINYWWDIDLLRDEDLLTIEDPSNKETEENYQKTLTIPRCFL